MEVRFTETFDLVHNLQSFLYTGSTVLAGTVQFCSKVERQSNILHRQKKESHFRVHFHVRHLYDNHVHILIYGDKLTIT